jgi:hypothetical protein
MKTNVVLVLALSLPFLAVPVSQAVPIADWTFETSQPTSAGPFSSEFGSGSASGAHVGAAVYSTPAGNGSSHSFSSTVWAVGDYYQFTVSSVGFSGIQISFDQTSSTTGPRDFILQYSTGGAYTQFGSQYSVLGNGTSPNAAWSAGTAVAAYGFSFDLSALTALNNQTTLSFRLVDNSTTSANGGTVGTGGTDRIDNFIVSGTSVSAPEQSSSLGLAALGFSACLAFGRKSIRFS